MVKINANKELHSSIMIIEECYVTRLFFDRKYITILLNGSVSGNTKEFQFQDLDYDFVWFTFLLSHVVPLCNYNKSVEVKGHMHIIF